MSGVSLHQRQDPYRGASLIKNNPSLGPYSRLKPWAIWWTLGEGLFLMNEVTLYMLHQVERRGKVLTEAGRPLGPRF